MSEKSESSAALSRLRGRLNQPFSGRADFLHACSFVPGRSHALSSESPRGDSRRLLAEKFHALKLLSFNIQVGITTQSYKHYVTRSWQHLLPSRRRMPALDSVAQLLRDYDIIALQEVDGGSIRSDRTNQVAYLAEHSGHPYWYQQLNRNLGAVAQHSNGLVSRYEPLHVEPHRLPGFLPGRGCMLGFFGSTRDPLVVVNLHLALSLQAQIKQLDYLYSIIAEYNHIVIMGDMNNSFTTLIAQSKLARLDLHALPELAPSFPSWRPSKSLDHVAVSKSLHVERAGVVNLAISDHLPVEVVISRK
ncbi:endonuclease/exonuclease/phosphatase family protein [Allohahella marinimesophila]|uniref:Endonuclease/exonuclease/phosphatase family protein n=1 Tax=Allohahella marinimesophila TaxID=1054972 RepID=A0ABP7PK30_9GAMM